MLRHALYAGFVFLFTAVGAARGQSMTAQAEVEEALAGEPFVVKVSVTNSQTATAPTPPQSPDFQITMVNQQPAHSQQVQIVNGRMTKQETYTYSFDVQANRVGVVDIPPFEVNDGGRMIRSRPIRVTIKKPPSSPDVICRIETKVKERAWVGQKVDLSLVIWVRRFSQYDVDLTKADMWSRVDWNRSSMGIFVGNNDPRAGETSLPDESGNKVKYWVYKLDAALFPSKPGKLDVGDVQFSYRYPLALGRDVFGRLYVDRERRVAQRPELPDIDVSPLPLKGRPADFNGAVGIFSVIATAKPMEVSVSDPVTLGLSIRGSGPLERLSPPRLDQVEALTRDFEISGDIPAGEMENGTKVFSVTIRPLREDVVLIPSIPMSYFNPETAQYETSRSDAIPIKVKPAERLALSGDSGGLGGTSVLVPLVETTEGLLANESDPNRVLGSQIVAVGVGTWGLMIGSPVVFAAAWFVRRRSARHKSDAGLRRRSMAYKTARAALQGENGVLPPGRIRGALLGYIADRCNAPAGLMRADAVQLMTRRSVPADTVRAVDVLIDLLEQAEYGGGQDRGADAAVKARALLDELERCNLK